MAHAQFRPVDGIHYTVRPVHKGLDQRETLAIHKNHREKLISKQICGFQESSMVLLQWLNMMNAQDRAGFAVDDKSTYKRGDA